MSVNWEAGYAEAIRGLMKRKGRPVKINPNAEYDFDEVSTYGWVDYDADTHGKPLGELQNPDRWRDSGYDDCGWVVPEGAVLKERTYSQFQDTGSANANEVGINVYGCRCNCGRYTDVVLRYDGSLGDVLRELFGQNAREGVVL